METIHLYKTKKELIEESSKRGITVKQLIAEIKATAKAERRKKVLSHQQKLNYWKVHRFDADVQLVKKHTSAQARFEKVIQDKIKGLHQFKKQTNMSDKAFEAAKERIEKHSQREKALEERRADRRARIEKEALRVTKKMKSDLERFIQAEQLRKTRKEEKRSKYAGKKMKVAPRPIVDNPTVKLKKNEAIYSIEIHYRNNKSILPPTSPYTLDKLEKRMSDIHTYQLGKKNNGYIGVYAYNIANPSVCVKEMVKPEESKLDSAA